ncbi:uncharacterized protein [Nicotiana tomentosiformis]|uniref:uncharacterized protein n=1 Tax=Nicotiana tomentosiformis TaxID=4098 RepID=UPI00388C9011
MNKVGTSSLFNEAQQALNRASMLHHESFFRSCLEISQLELEVKEKVQKDMYMDLSEQQDEALKDLPILHAELEKAQNEASSLMGEHADLVKKVQKKVDLINQLRDEMNEVKAMTEAWKSRMNLLGSEKEAVKEELASAKDQLQLAKNKVDKWSQLNDELRAQLNSDVTERDALGQEYAVLRSKLEATYIDSSDLEEMLAQYKADVEIVEACLKTKIEYVKRLFRRETFEEIHA